MKIIGIEASSHGREQGTTVDYYILNTDMIIFEKNVQTFM